MIVAELLAKKGSDVTAVKRDASIQDAVDVLAARGIGAVVVLDDESRLVGIFTERDLVRVLHNEGSQILGRPVSQAMTADPLTCTRADKISDVLATMSRRHFRHMPVVENGSVIGVVSIRDLATERLDHVETEARAMRDYLSSA